MADDAEELEDDLLDDDDADDEVQRGGRRNVRNGLPPTPVGTTDITDDRQLWEFFVDFIGAYRDIEDTRLQPKSLSTKQRLGDAGRHEQSLDNFAMELAARALSAGGDVDSYISQGGLSRRWVPLARRRVDTQPMRTFRARLLNGNQVQPSKWSDLVRRLEELSGLEGRIVLTDGDGNETDLSLDAGELQELRDFLGMIKDEAREYLRQHFGDKLRTADWVNKWAQHKGHYDPNLAYQGETAWEIAPIKGDVNSHRYRLFQTMPIEWVDAFERWYFINHPHAVALKTLRDLTKINDLQPLGNGPLRRYGFNEVWCPPVASAERQRVVAGNYINWQANERLRGHVLEAYQLAFEFYVERFEHSARAYRELEGLYGIHAPDPTADEPLSIKSGTQPYAELERNYEGFGTQVPPSIIYGKGWKRIEALAQLKRRLLDGQSPRGQYLGETVEGFERSLDIFSWIERPFQVGKDGTRYDSWYAKKNHDCQTTSKYWLWVKNPQPSTLEVDSHSYCTECVKWDNWKPAHLMTVEELSNGEWEYREVNVEYATRQEEQQWRKIIGTHNRGSAMSGHYLRGNLSSNTVATSRDAYVGGFQEAIAGKAWYFPGMGTLTPLRDIVENPTRPGEWQIRRRTSKDIPWDDPRVVVEVADITHHGIVSRQWWLGHFLANRINTDEEEPFNNDWMEHFLYLVEHQESRKAVEALLAKITTAGGVFKKDLIKAKEHLQTYQDGVVTPTTMGRKSLGIKNEFGRNWVEFTPELDPFKPRLHRYADLAFHTDELWFEKRNFWSPVILRMLINKYKQAFGEDKRFRITWSDGTKQDNVALTDPDFWLYLNSNWFDHKLLGEDIRWNQEVEPVMETVKEELEYAENDGQAFLRPMLYKLTEGLPLDPFRPHIARERERVDGIYTNRLALYAATGHRGVSPAMITSATEKGHLLGYGDYKVQHTRVVNAFKSALWNKWGDHIAWTLRYFQMIPNPKDPVDVRNFLAKELASGSMNWEAAEMTAFFLGQFMGGIWGKRFTYATMLPKRPPQEQAFEEWFDYTKLVSMLPPVGDDNLEARKAIIWAAHNKLILHTPTTPEGLRNWH